MGLQKTNAPGLLKDVSSGVVINTNNGEYDRILAERKKKREQDEIKNRVDSLSKRIDEISSHVNDIRMMLQKVLHSE